MTDETSSQHLTHVDVFTGNDGTAAYRAVCERCAFAGPWLDARGPNAPWARAVQHGLYHQAHPDAEAPDEDDEIGAQVASHAARMAEATRAVLDALEDDPGPLLLRLGNQWPALADALAELLEAAAAEPDLITQLAQGIVGTAIATSLIIPGTDTAGVVAAGGDRFARTLAHVVESARTPEPDLCWCGWPESDHEPGDFKQPARNRDEDERHRPRELRRDPGAEDATV